MNMNPIHLFNRPVSAGSSGTSDIKDQHTGPEKNIADNMLKDLPAYERTESGMLTMGAIKEIERQHPVDILRTADSIKNEMRQGQTFQMFQDPRPDYDTPQNQQKLYNELDGYYMCHTTLDKNILTGEAVVTKNPAALRDDVVLEKHTPNHLINEFSIHPRVPQIRQGEYATAAQLPGMPSGISMTTLESLPSASTATDTAVATQTDTAKNSPLSRYGSLVASSLAAILGAVLIIVAKTHGHDEMEVEGADNLQPQEPDYDAIGQQAAREAEQAFVDKWQDPDIWGPGKVNQDGENLETGEKNPYYGVKQDQETGKSYISDELTSEGERTLPQLKETAAEHAVSQARADYDKALEEANQHNKEHTAGTLQGGQNGKDHNAMLGVGATLLGLGGLAATLVAGNKLTHRSHDKQQTQGISPEHGSLKNFVEQKLFRVKA